MKNYILRRYMENEIKEHVEAQQEAVELTFWDHLEVLRWGLVRIVEVLFVCMIIAFIAMPYIFNEYI